MCSYNKLNGLDSRRIQDARNAAGRAGRSIERGSVNGAEKNLTDAYYLVSTVSKTVGPQCSSVKNAILTLSGNTQVPGVLTTINGIHRQLNSFL